MGEDTAGHSFVVGECAIGSRFRAEGSAVVRGVVRSEVAAPLTFRAAKAIAKRVADPRGKQHIEYWRQDHNARNDNHTVQLRKLRCPLSLN